MHKNILILSVTQMLLTSIVSAMTFIGALISSEFVLDKSLVTIPITLLIVGIFIGVLPSSYLMSLYGRKRVFIGASLFQALFIYMMALSIYYENFIVYSVSGLLIGLTLAVVNQFRFAAMESVSMNLMPRASSVILFGSVFSAWLGPEIVELGEGFVFNGYAGSFVLLVIPSLLGVIVLFFYNELSTTKTDVKNNNELDKGLKEPVLWMAIFSGVIGFSIMSFIMVSTPMSMHGHSHDIGDTKTVMQTHIALMFLPSLITPILIQYLGFMRVIVTGLLLYIATIVLLLVGNGMYSFWVALALLGIGWNLLFISGTSLLPIVYSRRNKLFIQSLNDGFVFGSQAIGTLFSAVALSLLGWSGLLTLSFMIVCSSLIGIFVFYRTTQENIVAQST